MTAATIRATAKVPEPRRSLENEDTEPITAPPPPDPAAIAWALVQRAQAGDGDAFALIYDRYVDTVFRFVYFRVGRRRQIAEDLTSEVWLRALRRIDSFAWRGQDLGAWLITIARNAVADYFKSGHYRLSLPFAVPGWAGGNDPADDATGPEDAAVVYLSGLALMRALGELGDLQRQVLVLRYLRGLSVSETAAAMGRQEGAVKALTFRATQAIRRSHPELGAGS